MNYLKAVIRFCSKLCIVVGFFLLFLPCYAFAGNGGGIYIVAFIKYIVSCILILVALSFAVLRVKNREVKLCLYVLLLLTVVVPIVQYSVERYDSKRSEAEYEKRISESNNDFAQFCSDHQAKVYKTVRPKQNSSIFIRVIKPFAGDPSFFRAGYICAIVQNKRLCQKLGVKYIEGNNHEQQWRKYEVCDSSDGKLISKITAQYELIIDGSTTTSQMSWEEMIKNEIRIIDTKTGEVLAKDTIFFLGTKTGKAGCPDATDQVVDLIQMVFGNTGEQ